MLRMLRPKSELHHARILHKRPTFLQYFVAIYQRAHLQLYNNFNKKLGVDRTGHWSFGDLQIQYCQVLQTYPNDQPPFTTR